MHEFESADAALRAYRRKRGRGAELRTGVAGVIIDVLMFRRMITPWLVRMSFVIVLLVATLAVLAGSLDVVGQAFSGQTKPALTGPRSKLLPGEFAVVSAPSSPFASQSSFDYLRLGTMLAPLGIVVGVRIILEMCIVLFQISETLTDLRSLAREERTTGR